MKEDEGDRTEMCQPEYDLKKGKYTKRKDIGAVLVEEQQYAAVSKGATLVGVVPCTV